MAASAAYAAPTTDADVKAACSADFQKYCPGADDEKVYRHCARAHFFKLTRECRHVLMHYRSATKGKGASDEESGPQY
jgi:hypothetical protein